MIYSLNFEEYESGQYHVTRYPNGCVVWGAWVVRANSDEDFLHALQCAVNDQFVAPETRDPHDYTVDFKDSTNEK